MIGKLHVRNLALATALSICGSVYAQDEVKVLLEENFDAFTEGSVETPATTDISSYSSGKLADVLTGWRGSKVYEAGGSLRIGEDDFFASGAYIQTPSLNAASPVLGGGNIRITVRLKSAIESNIVTVGSEMVGISDSEWHDYVIVTDRSVYNLKVSGVLGSFYIDNVKVEQGTSILMTPTAYRPTDFDGTKFTASWKKVTNAESYLLDVYSYAADGSKEYVLKDDAVTETSKVVNVPSADKKYYFTVRAKTGENVSLESEEQDVVKVVSELDAPVAKDATNVKTDGFTANWEAVANADKYTVSVSMQKVLGEATPVDVLAEDFAGITEGTLESVEYINTSSSLDGYTKLPGWFAVNGCFAAGYMGLSPYGTDPGYIETPILDLSKSNGAFTLDVKMAEGFYGTYFTGAVIKFELVGSDDAVLESKEVTIDEAAFKNYTVAFTKGTANSYVRISYTHADSSSSYKFFMDEIKMTQEYAAGDLLQSLVLEKETEETSLAIALEMDPEATYSYTVKASVETVNSQGDDVVVYSGNSNSITVKQDQGAVENAVVAGPSVRVSNGKLIATLAEDAAISVYDLSGRLIASVAGHAGENELDANGFVIIKIGEETFKAIVR